LLRIINSNQPVRIFKPAAEAKRDVASEGITQVLFYHGSTPSPACYGSSNKR
jgi:hypothetical protein